MLELLLLKLSVDETQRYFQVRRVLLLAGEVKVKEYVRGARIIQALELLRPVYFKFVLVELQPLAREVDLGSAERAQVGPGHRIEHL